MAATCEVELRRRRAVELRAEGSSHRAIAAELGVSHMTVGRDLEGVPEPDQIISTAGTLHHLAGRALEARKHRARALHAEGWTIHHIAEELGVHRETVGRDVADDDWWLSADDVEWRPTGFPPEELRVVLEQARAEGAPFEHAWRVALPLVLRPGRFRYLREREEWRRALEWARPEFRAAYAGEPGMPGLEKLSPLIAPAPVPRMPRESAAA